MFFHLPKISSNAIYKYLLLPKNPTLARWLLASVATPINRVKEFLNDNKIPEMDFFLGLQTFREKGPLKWVETQGEILLVGGKEDKLAKPKDMKQLNKLIPHSKLEILPNAGHLPPYEIPERFNRLVEEFIEES